MEDLLSHPPPLVQLFPTGVQWGIQLMGHLLSYRCVLAGQQRYQNIVYVLAWNKLFIFLMLLYFSKKCKNLSDDVRIIMIMNVIVSYICVIALFSEVTFKISVMDAVLGKIETFLLGIFLRIGSSS